MFEHLNHLDQWTMAQRLHTVADLSSSEKRPHTTARATERIQVAWIFTQARSCYEWFSTGSLTRQNRAVSIAKFSWDGVASCAHFEIHRFYHRVINTIISITSLGSMAHWASSCNRYTGPTRGDTATFQWGSFVAGCFDFVASLPK